MKKNLRQNLNKKCKMGIAKRVTLVYAFIIVLLVFVFGQIFLFMQNEEIYQQAQNMSESGLEYAALNIEANIDTMMQIALTIMDDKELMELIAIKEEATARVLLESKDSINRLSGYSTFNPQIKDVKLYYHNPNLEQIPPSIVHMDNLRQQNWYHDFWTSDILSSVYFPVYQGNELYGITEDTISLYSKVIYRYRTLEAVIKVDMRIEEFLSYQEKKQSELYPQFFLWKEDGLLTARESTDIKLAWKIVEDVLQKELILNKSKRGYPESCAVSYKYIESLDAWLVSFVDTGKVLKSQVLFHVLVVVILLLTVVVLYFIVSFLAARMLNRLIQLQRIMQSGEMSFDTEGFGHDEIGDLAIHYHGMLENISSLMEKNTRVQIDLKNAEIQALQAQINSHFMYNTLESIGMLAVMHDDTETAEAIGLMGKIMRYDLDWSSTVVQLGKELEHVSNYMELMRIRQSVQEQKMELYTNITAELQKMKIPKMTLQPIVENAVQYSGAGIGTYKTIKISITACRIGKNMVAVDIVDDGKGIVPETTERLMELMNREIEESSAEYTGQTGIGLVNINRRLKLYFGEQYGLCIDSVQNVYTRVRILIPYYMNETEERNIWNM